MGLEILLLLLAFQASAFTIPGVSTQVYTHGEEITLYMNELESKTNQVPYDPYFLKTCKPHKQIRDNFQNLGSLLLGEKTVNSPYQIFVGIEMQCQYLCELVLSELDVNDYIWFISHNYRINMELDNLPVITNTTTFAEPKYDIQSGYPIGSFQGNDFYINNHVTFDIEIHPIAKDQYRIVGFQAKPMSQIYGQIIVNGTLRNIPSCTDVKDGLDEQTFPFPQVLQKGLTVVFSYDVKYTINPNKTHGSRWDIYINKASDQIQWVSLTVSFLIAALLTGIVALLLRLALRRDLLKYKVISELPQAQEITDQGWKQLSRDVFRQPSQPMLFSVLLGTGVQLIALTLCILFLACLGFVYQSHRGNIITMMVVVFVFTGSINGFYTARFYKYFKGAYWLLCTCISNLAFPFITILTQWIIHLFLSAEDSSSTITFKSVLTFVALWLGIQVPLNLVGSFIGFKVDSPKNPSQSYPIAQPVPPQPWYLEEFYSCVIGGLICFASVGVEFSFIMQLMWSNAFYQFFISLSLSVVLLFVISAEISIIVTYLSLCKGNHVWWWKSFLVPFSAGIYLFIYSLQYYMAELTFTRLSAIVFYFGTMFLVSLVFGLICGTVGFIASYKFVRGIYGLIKHD